MCHHIDPFCRQFLALSRACLHYCTTDQEQSPGHPRGDGNCKDNCDCGENPCGEYLWDHRNGSSLRDFLVNEFVLGPNGLANPAIDGFYLDDSWHTAPKVAPTAPWRSCDKSPTGGATEENPYCSIDMGLSDTDVADITGNWSATIEKRSVDLGNEHRSVMQSKRCGVVDVA